MKNFRTFISIAAFSFILMGLPAIASAQWNGGGYGNGGYGNGHYAYRKHKNNTGKYVALGLGALMLGIYQASASYYRFAAADLASPQFRPKAISWVMTGGVAAALFGMPGTTTARPASQARQPASTTASAVIAAVGPPRA